MMHHLQGPHCQLLRCCARASLTAEKSTVSCACSQASYVGLYGPTSQVAGLIKFMVTCAGVQVRYPVCRLKLGMFYPNG